MFCIMKFGSEYKRLHVANFAMESFVFFDAFKAARIREHFSQRSFEGVETLQSFGFEFREFKN